MARWFTLGLWALCSFSYGLDREALAGLLQDAREEMDMPGLRAAVGFPDGRIVKASVGLADVEANVPLDDVVAMPGGSTGKPFVATLTMLLVEDGVLGLDDPVSDWLATSDWYQSIPNANSIRVRHLLSHASGIADYPGTRGYLFGSIWRALRHGGIRFEPEELIGFASKRSPLFAPDEGFAYTDAGYLVLGKLIEAATGRAYFDLLRERILEPLSLDEIVLQDRSILPGITTGYMAGARNLREDGSMKIDPSSEWTGGGLATNPTMLVRFFSALAKGEIVSEEGLDQMLEAGWRNPETPGEHYGFGLFVYDLGAAFGHGGMWPGYRTHVMHYAAPDITIAVQTNRDGRIDLHGLIGRIKESVEKPPRLTDPR